MQLKNIKINDVQTDLGLLIASLRKAKKLSQKDFAEQLGLSRITIQNLEAGNNFTIETLLKALQYFDLLDDLQQFTNEIKNKNNNLNSLY